MYSIHLFNSFLIRKYQCMYNSEVVKGDHTLMATLCMIEEASDSNITL